MFQLTSSTVTMLSILHWAAASQVCSSPERICDFVCDCSDCSDESGCGYRGPSFDCDFEDEDMCGWTDESPSGDYRWERRQRGHVLEDSGPSSDFTTGTGTGWFVGVTAVTSDTGRSAVLLSPQMKQTSPTCRLRLTFFLWDSGRTGWSSSPLWASVLHQDGQQAAVWRPEATSVRGWREATVFLGRIPSSFRVRLVSERSRGRRGDVAIDQMEFVDCALPLPLSGQECPVGMVECERGGCVEQRHVCDASDDCGDGTDEKNCAQYRYCDFEKDTCDWDLRSLSTLKWTRRSQKDFTDLQQGPGRDQTLNSATGHFLYVTTPDGELHNDWAAFQSPLLDPAPASAPCRMVMYTHQWGPRCGGLTVLVADRHVHPVWQRGGALGDVWVKAEVEIVSNSTFQIVVMAAVRDASHGGVGVDSVLLSPECRLSSGNGSWATFPKPPPEPCAPPDQICDFSPDCAGAQDEDRCGDFSSPSGATGWTDSSVGGQSWMLHHNVTTREEYLYVVEAPGKQRTEAQTKTPPLGPSGPACTFMFDFALTGNPDHIGELMVRLVDQLGTYHRLWRFSGRTGADEGVLRHTAVHIGVRRNRFQVALEARAVHLQHGTKIQVTNVHFIDCHADYLPSSTTGLACNFEDDLCGWYQDKEDNFDWTVEEGTDHTVGVGRSLVVDMWCPSLRGTFGRLLSLPQSLLTEHCLSFYYKLYGPNTGTLTVKRVDPRGVDSVLWMSSGAQGNMWHEAECTVPPALTPVHLMLEAIRSGFDGQVAVDDVALVSRPCVLPRFCSFEGQTCGFSSSGASRWIHRNGRGSSSGPPTDHTLETPQGFYFLVNSGLKHLPSGAAALLSSAVRQGTTRMECVSFWYHMGGDGPGSLTVYVKPVEGDRVKIFSDSLSEGNVWRHGNGNISSSVDWQLQFEVLGVGGTDGHVAVDDVFLSARPCERSGSLCTLEAGMCTWSNTRTDDQLDWVLTSRWAERHYSTPMEDHTLGTDRGHFLFLPCTNRSAANQNAKLLSHHLPSTRGTCLKFWTHKPSSSDSQLKVWTLSKEKLHQQLVLRDFEGHWKRFEVDITSTEEYQMVFEGITGTSGAVALDDIQFTVGINCANEATDLVTTSSRDNTGGIVASVVVVLLLIGTLMLLLVFYLRSHRASSPSSLSSAAGFSNETYEPELVSAARRDGGGVNA